MSKSLQKIVFDVITYTLLILGALTMLLPFLWMVSVSFREPAAQFSRYIIPNPFTLQNYVDLFKDLPDQAFLYLTFNSFKLSILTVIGQTLTCAMAAFVFAIVKFRGRDFIFALLLATLMIPRAGFPDPQFYYLQISSPDRDLMAAHPPGFLGRRLRDIPPAAIFPHDPT